MQHTLGHSCLKLTSRSHPIASDERHCCLKNALSIKTHANVPVVKLQSRQHASHQIYDWRCERSSGVCCYQLC